MILDKENSLYAKCIQVFLITMIVVFEPEGLFGKMCKSVRLKLGHTSESTQNLIHCNPKAHAVRINWKTTFKLDHLIK